MDSLVTPYFKINITPIQKEFLDLSQGNGLRKTPMDFFFEPNGIAVVGATPESYSGGRNLLTNLTLGYKGPIYPVNPKYDEILGLKCYPRVSGINGPLDLCIIFVPARAVPQVLEDCVL